jgi:chemotaxis protein MotB
MKLEEEEKENENSERWLLTYSDMITLLLVLFIMMFAISSLDANKFGALSDQLGIMLGYGGKVVPFGISEGLNENVAENIKADAAPTAASTPEAYVDISDMVTDEDTRDDLEDMLKLIINSKELKSDVTIKLESRGVVVSFQEVLLFPSGSATVSAKGRGVIKKLAGVINKVDNYISVEGSTDNVPISGARFASNWELAAQRAINVTKLLIKYGVKSSRVSATSYGQYRPVARNNTRLNKAKNRRVDIVFINRSLDEYQAGYSKNSN